MIGNNSYSEILSEDLLTETTRAQLVSVSRNADLYIGDTSRGKNRFERKKFSKVAKQVKLFNDIDMNDFFKKDLLTVKIPVTGETNEYTVYIQLDGVVEEMSRNIKTNSNKFEYRTVIQSITKVFNTTNVRVKCSCPDFQFRYAHQLIINNESVDDTSKDPGPGKTGMANSKGKGCKHILLCLNNGDWIMKIASCIKNYITYMDENKHELFMKLIFPKLYSFDATEAEENGIIPEDTDLDTTKNIIDVINDWAKNRGKFKKGSNKNPITGTGGRQKKETEEKEDEEK